MYSVSAETIGVECRKCRRWKTGNWTYRAFPTSWTRKSGLCLQPQQPNRATDQSADFRTLLELTRGKAIVVADEAISSFARRHRWLAG